MTRRSEALGAAEGAGGMVWVLSFRCACGAWCEEWHDLDRDCWRVRHGEGEAVFTIGRADLGGDDGGEDAWQRWLARCHEYEGCKA